MRIPSIFRSVPQEYSVCNPVASVEELVIAREIRSKFQNPGDTPYSLLDMVRAFRLLRGLTSYVEVGSRDKGNVAYAEALLAPGSRIMEIDIEETPRESEILKATLSDQTTFESVVGDCLSPAVIDKVRKFVGPEGADVIFCDTLHFYEHAMIEFDTYFSMVKRGGYIFIHDCYYEGDAKIKGKAQALSEIDRIIPVCAIIENEPVHRFLPRGRRDIETWAGLAVIRRV